MALFKILNNFASGNTSLPTTYVQGYCYFDKNTGKLWIDTTNAASGRMALNANKADKDGDGNTISSTYLKSADISDWAKASTKPSYTYSEVGAAASSHSHGNILSGGTMTASGVALANNDTLLFVDSSDSSKIKQTSIKFDGSTTTKALTQKGTFETFSTFSGSYNDLTNKPTIPDGNDYVAKAGDTMSGNLIVSKASSASVVVKSTDTNLAHQVSLSTSQSSGMGGIYSSTRSKWMLTTNNTDTDVHLNSNTTADSNFNTNGALNVKSTFNLRNSTKWPGILVQLSNNTDARVAELWYTASDGTTTNDVGKITTGIWNFRAYSPNSTADTSTTGKSETYVLPTVDSGLSANKTYNILTSKDTYVREASGIFGHGSALSSSTDLDSLTGPGVYYSSGSTVSATIPNTPTSASGYKLIYLQGYNDNYAPQIAFSSSQSPLYRVKAGASTWGAWNKLVYIPYGSSIGGSATPVYIDSNGLPIACTTANIQAGKDGDGNTISSTYVKKAGDSMTGNLSIAKTNGTSVYVESTGSGYVHKVGLITSSNAGRGGIYSATRSKWLINTNNDDTNVHLPSTTVADSVLYMNDGSGVFNTSGTPMFYFKRAGDGETATKLGTIFAYTTTVNSKKVMSRFYLRQYSYNSSGDNAGDSIEKWEQYLLPQVAADLSSSTNYNLITSKDVTNRESSAIFAKGEALTSSSNLDNLTGSGVYYSSSSTISGSISNGPTTSYGFKVIQFQGYGDNYPTQLATTVSGSPYFRYKSGGNWVAWNKLAYIVSGSSVGNSSTPVYVASTGKVTACDLSGLYVAKAGDTMTGNLNIKYATPLLNITNTGVTRGTTPSADQVSGVIFGDNSSTTKYTAYLKSGVYADGSTEVRLYNYAPTSSTAHKSIYVQYTTSSTWKAGANCAFYGAVYNDYAEFRETKVKIEPGRCIIETGKGDLVLATERLQPGAEIVSDTYGFAIGQTEKCQTPTATTGRVLAYPYENRDEFKAGDPVCSGPNGTISKMTREEVREWPDRMIGTVSEIPDYDVWIAQDENDPIEIKVNGRIWIRIR